MGRGDRDVHHRLAALQGSGTAEVPVTGQDPAAVCARMWAQGYLNPGAHRAPPLVACSLDSFDGGSVGVDPDTTGQRQSNRVTRRSPSSARPPVCPSLNATPSRSAALCAGARRGIDHPL